MPRIKIIWVENFQLDDYDTKQIARSIDEGEFEEISLEELQALRTNLYKLPRPSYNFEPRILLLDDEPLSSKLESIKVYIEKEKQKALAAEKARKVAAAKRKAALLERKKKQYEALKKEFDE